MATRTTPAPPTATSAITPINRALESSARQRRLDLWIKHCLAIHLAQDYANNYAEDNYAHTYTDQNLVAVR